MVAQDSHTFYMAVSSGVRILRDKKWKLLNSLRPVFGNLQWNFHHTLLIEGARNQSRSRRGDIDSSFDWRVKECVAIWNLLPDMGEWTTYLKIVSSSLIIFLSHMTLFTYQILASCLLYARFDFEYIINNHSFSHHCHPRVNVVSLIPNCVDEA